MLYLATLALLVVLVPHNAYAWGPGVHIGVSLSVLSQIGAPLASSIMANLNEFLYGALAPDFIVGKKFSRKEGHSHAWEVGFDILDNAETDAQKAFAYGYLAHLAQDAVAHGIMIPREVGNLPHKSARHFYLEAFADSYCDKTYKYLAKVILSKYNAPLDNQIKFRVHSALFSFPVSKLIFKGFARLTLNKRFVRIVSNRHIVEMFHLQADMVNRYIQLSREFTVDVLKKTKDSPVVKIRAISE